MNLLAKIWNGLLIIAGLFIFSCEDPSDIGLALDPDALSTQISYKEITLTAENVFNDSLKTSNTSVLLVGKSQSDIFGTTESTAYVRLSTDNSSLSPLDTDGVTQYYVYDSTVLTLQYFSVNADHVANTQTISVHQLEDQLISSVSYLSRFDTPYMANDPDDTFDFKIDKEDLDEALENPLDTPNYQLTTHLSAFLGQQLFDIVESNETQELLRDDFKGIAFVSDPNNDALIGFNAGGGTNITVHYHIMEETEDGPVVDTDSLGIVFSLTSANARYNKIEVDRTGSLIGANIGEDLATFETGDGKVYMNPATGIYPKVSLQPLYDFFEEESGETGQPILISRAELVVTSALNDGEYRANNANFRMLFMNEGKQVNTSGLIIGDLVSSIVSTDIGYLGGSQAPLIASFTDSLTDYRASMTFFIQLVENGDVYSSIDAEGNKVRLESFSLMPSDIQIADYSVIDLSDIKLNLYYAQPN
ncbi:MAG: DUF4270 family protein [Reichenbachiella sp.]